MSEFIMDANDTTYYYEEYWETWTDFLLEGVTLPLIAIFGIAGLDNLAIYI